MRPTHASSHGAAKESVSSDLLAEVLVFYSSRELPSVVLREELRAPLRGVGEEDLRMQDPTGARKD